MTSPDKAYLLVGGTSGFGFATAEWLIAEGARDLVLASRSGVKDETIAAAIEAHRAAGVSIELATLDVTDADATRCAGRRDHGKAAARRRLPDGDGARRRAHHLAGRGPLRDADHPQGRRRPLAGSRDEGRPARPLRGLLLDHRAARQPGSGELRCRQRLPRGRRPPPPCRGQAGARDRVGRHRRRRRSRA